MKTTIADTLLDRMLGEFRWYRKFRGGTWYLFGLKSMVCFYWTRTQYDSGLVYEVIREEWGDGKIKSILGVCNRLKGNR